MLKLHTKSQYGLYHIPVIIRVVSTNKHTHYCSAVVSGGTSFHAKTAHQVSAMVPTIIPVILGVVSTNYLTYCQPSVLP